MRAPSTCSLLLAAAASCDLPAPGPIHLEGTTMGTLYSVQVARPPAGVEAGALHRELDRLLRDLDGAMSTYDPASEVSRFNASDSTDWFAVSPDTLAVVECAQRVSRLSGGAFDVTVGPLVELWGFGPRRSRRQPAPAELAAALERVGFEQLEWSASPPALRKRHSALRIDLSAIAKGFAVDRVSGALEARGVRDYLVDIGGELRACGSNAAGEPWRVAVERPPAARQLAPCLFRLDGWAVASSGDYRIAFEEDGVRYAHVIDPRSGRPVTTGVASATVLSGSAMEADALATTLLVLAPDEGLRLAGRLGVPARLLVREEGALAEYRTPDFPVLDP